MLPHALAGGAGGALASFGLLVGLEIFGKILKRGGKWRLIFGLEIFGKILKRLENWGTIFGF